MQITKMHSGTGKVLSKHESDGRQCAVVLPKTGRFREENGDTRVEIGERSVYGDSRTVVRTSSPGEILKLDCLLSCSLENLSLERK